jgi:hypothetical protein
MAILVMEESTGGIIPEGDIVQAKVTACEQRVAPFKDDNGNEVVRIEFTFTIEEPGSPYDGQRIFGSTSNTFTNHPDCKLRAWAQELLVTELEPGFTLDTDTLIGQRCRVVVGVRETEKNGLTKTRNYAQDIMRPRDGAPYKGMEEEPF